MPRRQSRLRQEHGAEFAGADHADSHRPAGGFALEKLGMKVLVFSSLRNAKHRPVGGTSRRFGMLAVNYWQSARETKVSSVHSAGGASAGHQTLAGQTSAVVMSRLFPESKPLALHMRIGRGDAIGRTVRRMLAFLMAADSTGLREFAPPRRRHPWRHRPWSWRRRRPHAKILNFLARVLE